MSTSSITILWTINATVAMTLALFCALAWGIERRNLGYLMFCLIAVSTAACTPFELGMMHSQTPAEYGAWLKGYHLPIFFVLLGQALFVHFYLGTGLRWLLLIFFAWRLAILVTNFLAEPNFHFYAIDSLRQVPYLGEQISVVGSGKLRAWQGAAIASILILVGYVIDAAVRRWRKGDAESHRKALVVGLGIGIPMVCNLVQNQLAVMGVIHRPIFATLWFLGILSAIAYEMARELIISARARLQVAQLRSEIAQLGRVDIMGQLATGLAHELAQPLTASLVNIETAQLQLRKDKPDIQELRAIVDDIHSDWQRTGDVLDRMRKLIQRQAVDKQAVVISDVIRDVTGLLHSEVIARNVQLEVNVAPDLPPVMGDRVQISQVILNLLVNAMDAMQGLTARARCVFIDVQAATNGTLKLMVTDSGPGISPQKLKEIFAPLYTTKPGSLGLGLALSRTIVEAHGGQLWAENRLGQDGAVMTMTLPTA
jgi:signal transduction histidine kinase